MKFVRFFVFIFGMDMLGIGDALAQQTPLFPDYHYNPFVVNPAYAGMADGPLLHVSHNQFTRKIEGSPMSAALSFHAPLANGKMGLGAAVVDDRIGVGAISDAVLAYSYKLFVDFKRNRPYWEIYDQHVFSFGMTAGVKRLREDFSELGVSDDPEFAANLLEHVPVVGAGVLYNRLGFYMGLSMPNLLGNRLVSRSDLRLSSPVYGYGGYRFYMDLYKEFMVTPNVLVKYEQGAPVQVDMNVAATLRNKFELGAGFRTSSTVNLLAGFYVAEQLRVIYHYNIGLNHPVLGNNHGISLSFAFRHH